MIIIKDDSNGKEQMRSSMREEMRRGGNYRSGGNYRGGGNYRTEEAYREGYRHGWEDSEDEEHYRRQRDSMGRFV